MTRWLIGICLVAVTAGVLFRYLSHSDDTVTDRRDTDHAAYPAPPESPEVKALQERLLRDDTLAPPPADASPPVQRTYRLTIQAIERGQDPLLEKALDNQGLSQEEITRVAADMQRRMQERQKVARQRKEEDHGRDRRKLDEERAQEIMEREARSAWRGPNRPPGQRLVAPLDLGPAVTFEEDENPNNAQPPPALPE